MILGSLVWKNSLYPCALSRFFIFSFEWKFNAEAKSAGSLQGSAGVQCPATCLSVTHTCKHTHGLHYSSSWGFPHVHHVAVGCNYLVLSHFYTWVLEAKLKFRTQNPRSMHFCLYDKGACNFIYSLIYLKFFGHI